MTRLTEALRKELTDKGRPDLIEVMEINESGYAGMLRGGQIVDRRKHPEAIAVQENSLLGIPKPKQLKDE
jgi:hypothetical protein